MKGKENQAGKHDHVENQVQKKPQKRQKVRSTWLDRVAPEGKRRRPGTLFLIFFSFSQIIPRLKEQKSGILQYILVSCFFSTCLAYLHQVLIHMNPPPTPVNPPSKTNALPNKEKGTVKDGGGSDPSEPPEVFRNIHV